MDNQQNLICPHCAQTVRIEIEGDCGVAQCPKCQKEFSWEITMKTGKL